MLEGRCIGPARLCSHKLTLCGLISPNVSARNRTDGNECRAKEAFACTDRQRSFWRFQDSAPEQYLSVSLALKFFSGVYPVQIFGILRYAQAKKSRWRRSHARLISGRIEAGKWSEFRVESGKFRLVVLLYVRGVVPSVPPSTYYSYLWLDSPRLV